MPLVCSRYLCLQVRGFRGRRQLWVVKKVFPEVSGLVIGCRKTGVYDYFKLIA